MSTLGVWMLVGLALTAAPKRGEDRGGTIELYVGEQRVVTPGCKLQRISVDATPVGGLQRIAVGDAMIADVKTIGHNQILFIGGAEGKTTTLVWCSNGERFSYLVVVRKGPRPPGEPIAVPVKRSEQAATVVDDRGARSTQVTMVEFPGDIREVTEVIDSDGGLVLVGLDSAGRKVTVTATPYRPRASRDAGFPSDAGTLGDGG